MPKVGMPAIRRPQLVAATVAVIDEVGLAGASVSLISRKAGVSAGSSIITLVAKTDCLKKPCALSLGNCLRVYRNA